MRPHVARARAIKGYFAASDHFLNGRPALGRELLEQAEKDREAYEQARQERAERRRGCGI